jgi:hypothetical protein
MHYLNLMFHGVETIRPGFTTAFRRVPQVSKPARPGAPGMTIIQNSNFLFRLR